jgi:hypothetical protein
MIQTKNIINFTVGMILGVIGSAMWQYDKFLYYSVFCLQSIIIYILINSSTSDKSDSAKAEEHNKGYEVNQK